MNRSTIIILLILFFIIITAIVVGLILLFGGLGVGAYFIIKKMSNIIKLTVLLAGYILVMTAAIILMLLALTITGIGVFSIIGIPMGAITVIIYGCVYMLSIIVGAIFLGELGHNFKISGWQYPVHIIMMLILPGYGFGLPFQYAMYKMGGQPYA